MRSNQKSKGPLPWGALLFNSFIGLIFVLVNFPSFLTTTILGISENSTWHSAALAPISRVQSLLTSLIGPSPENTFQTLMGYNFVVLWIYIIAVILFALRHLDWALLGFSLGGLFLGYAALHLISWLAIIIVSVLAFVATAAGWLFSILALVFDFVFVKGWWVWLILGLIAMIYALKNELLQILIGLGIAAGIGYLLYKIVPPIWRWFVRLITPILDFIKTIWMSYIVPVLAFIFKALLVILFLGSIILGIFFVLNTFGRLVVDQVRAAWYSGTGRKGVALGGFAIGSALALVILTSVAAPQVANGVNTGWTQSFEMIDKVSGIEFSSSALSRLQPTNLFVATMPSSVESFVFAYLTNIRPPIVDAALFFAVTILAFISVILRVIPSMPKVPTKIPVSFLPKEYFAIFGGLLLAVVIIFAQAFSEGES